MIVSSSSGSGVKLLHKFGSGSVGMSPTLVASVSGDDRRMLAASPVVVFRFDKEELNMFVGWYLLVAGTVAEMRDER